MKRTMFAAQRCWEVLMWAESWERSGDGATLGKAAHGNEERTPGEEIGAAGVKLADQADFRRNPAEPCIGAQIKKTEHIANPFGHFEHGDETEKNESKGAPTAQCVTPHNRY